ncbi:MAG TPA: phage tail protein, partial [Syntrophobacteraceae bacterium]|nr:phage tail protein [Syntrophobacteraceae bacterium]
DFEYTLNEPVYSGVWNGSFKRAWTCNPAWIWYDLATNDRYGLGIDPSRIDKWSLYSIGQYCDAVDPTTGKFVGVSDGAGGLEPRFTMSLYLQTQEEAFHVLNAVASAFVSMPYWSSGMVCLAQDAPSDPTHLANRANVINGEFQYSGLGLKARHSVALVTWYDPDDACRPAVEVVEDPELIERFGWVTTDVLAVGCLSRSQAIRFGRWMLDSEKNQPETVTFRGSFYWADCMPGSLIRIQDPTYAGLRFGGLVASGSTKTSVKLDAPVTLEAGETYTLSVVLTDGSIADRAVTNVPGTYTTLTVEALPSAPGANAPWVLSASNVEPREFRVLVNRETAPNEFEILAVVHDSTKYARIYDNIELPAPPVSIIPTGPIEPLTNLDIQVFTHERGRNFALGVLLSWEPSTDPRVLFYEIEYRESDEDDWKRFGESTTASCERRRIAEGTYDFRIRAAGIGQSNWYTESSISIADPDELPPDVTGLKTRDGGNELFTGKECELVWDDMPDVSDTYARWKHEHYKIQ